MLAYILSLCEPKYHPIIEHIYYTYHDDMVRFAKFKLRNRNIPNYAIEAEDVVQNSFIKIITYAHKIEQKAAPKILKSYVFQIVKNESATFVHNYFKHPETEALENDFASFDDYTATVNILNIYSDINDAIDALDYIYSVPTYLNVVMDFEVAEIASMLEICEKTVYTRIERAKKMIREKVGKDLI